MGTRLGPYEILEAIGQGGMATVYRAYHPAMDRVVAVKVMRASFAGDADIAARFQREARLIAKLEHPHLLPIYDFDASCATPYIVMRYLEGGTLKDHMRRGRLPLETGLRLLSQVAAALDYAHRHGVVHRDIKPSNIMVDGEGNAFLADFGLARLVQPDQPGEQGLTLPGTVLGTPFYMAPEQAMGSEEVDGRADRYALGVILFELATGRLPFEGDHPVAVAMAHLNRPVPKASSVDPRLPPAFDAVVERAMAKAPEARFPSAVEMTSGALRALDFTDPGLVPRPGGDLLAPPSPTPSAEPHRTDSKATPAERRKLVTALGADLAELAESLAEADPESSSDPLSGLWEQFQRTVERFGGRTESRSVDGALVLWGVGAAREDDPVRAVSCALEMLAVARESTGGAGAALRVGVTTGSVLLSADRPSGRVTASGAPLLLAARLARAAPPGAVLVSKETQRHIREEFELEAGPALGSSERGPGPETFLVRRPRPASASGPAPRGRTFRRAELEQIQASFLAAGREGRARAVTVLADPGMGKGRLLSDFDRWLTRERLPYLRVAARATSETGAQPYALLRTAFSTHFGLTPADGPGAVRTKVAQAMSGSRTSHGEESETPIFFGRWLGNAQRAGGGATTAGSMGREFQETLAHQAARALAAESRRGVVVLELSDLHWADDASLEVVQALLREGPRLPMVALLFARPELLERRPSWGEGLPGHRLLELQPLDQREAAVLAGELLGPGAASSLVDLLVERSEGNPLYMEELAAALADEGILAAQGTGEGSSRARAAARRIPSTLTGLIQARLEGLDPEERAALQRGAVFGRLFWRGAVDALSEADGFSVEVQEALAGLERRGLVAPREGGSLPGDSEYAFSSTLLREVVLEAVPKRLLKEYSACAARWLAGQLGGRSAPWASAIGAHFERAGEAAEAARYFGRAGEQALGVSAFGDARGFLERALSLAGEGGAGELQEASLRLHLAEALGHLGEYGPALEHLERALAVAERAGEARMRADALYRMAQVALSRGDLPGARRRFEEALEAAGAEDRWAQAQALTGLGDVAWRAGEMEEAEGHLQAALMLARETGDTAQALECLHRLGLVALTTGDLDAAKAYLEECRAGAMESGESHRLVAALDGLGEVLLRHLEADEACVCLREALSLSEALGLHLEAVHAETGLALALLELGQRDEAREHLSRALTEAHARGEEEAVLRAAAGFALLRGGAAGTALAHQLAGHPASGADLRVTLAPLLAGHDPAPSEDAARPLDLDALVRELAESR